MTSIFVIILLLITFFETIPCEGMDDGWPPVSWKDCGISHRICGSLTSVEHRNVSSRIGGGFDAHTGEYPWYAYLLYSIKSGSIDKHTGQPILNYFACGASILNEWWILTAAHCAETPSLEASYTLQLGSIGRNTGRRHVIERVVMYPTYNKKQMTEEESKVSDRVEYLEKLLKSLEINDSKDVLASMVKEYEKLYPQYYYLNDKYEEYRDIAIMKVKNRIIPAFNDTHYTINSVCLPKSLSINTNNETLEIIGLGVDEYFWRYATLPDRLLSASTLMLDPLSCGSLRGHKKLDINICIKRYEEALDYWFLSPGSCHGDSGGPAHQVEGCHAIQLGIFSGGPLSEMTTPGCLNIGWLTRVSLYTDWIRSVVYPGQVAEDPSVTRVGPKTSRLLIISVITATIIAVFISSALLWLSLKILIQRH